MSEDAGNVRRLEGTDAFAAAAGEIASRARREIALLSFQLPNEFYGASTFAEAVKRMILDSAGRRARVRVLVQEPRGAATGNRLVTLGQELSSFVDFRQPAAEHADWRGEWLIVDERHLLERQAPESLVASCHMDAPPDARAALRRFDEVWEMAEPAAELRRLHLS